MLPESLVQRYFSQVLSICSHAIEARKNSRLAIRALEEGDTSKENIGLLIFFVIFGFIGFVIVFLIQYSAKLLLTLVVVEDPAPLYLPVETNNNESSETNDTQESTQDGDRRDFITSSVRKTLRHLRNEAGPLSPWRGLGANIFFLIANSFLGVILAAVLQLFFIPWVLAVFIGGVIGLILVSRFALAVTHIMISVPLPGRPWYRRVLDTPWSSARKTIPALLIYSACVQVVAILGHFASSVGVKPGAKIALFFAMFIAYVTLVIPALIVLVRVQASTLPDEINTIVPFDKTFGQDISLTNDALTVRGALKSLDWPVMRRTLIFLGKTVPIVLGVTVAYIIPMIMLAATLQVRA